MPEFPNDCVACVGNNGCCGEEGMPDFPNDYVACIGNNGCYDGEGTPELLKVIDTTYEAARG